jgi:NitT/TauT family transport system permease protein
LNREANRPLRNAVVLVAAIVVLWQIAYWIVGDVALRSPLQTLRFTAGLVQTAFFWEHCTNTLRAFGFALAIAVVLGLAIGFALGLDRLWGEAMEPMLVALYSIPKITLYPILLLAFGLGMSAKVAFGAIHGVIPVALFTLGAVRGIRPILLKTGRVLKLDSAAMVRSILFPAAVPEIFTGLRVGFSLTLIGTLLSEMFGSRAGLGYMLMQAIGLNSVTLIMSLTLLIVVFAVLANGLFLIIDKRLHRRA